MFVVVFFNSKKGIKRYVEEKVEFVMEIIFVEQVKGKVREENIRRIVFK